MIFPNVHDEGHYRIAEIPGLGRIGTSMISRIGNRIYLWLEFYRKPTRAELRQLRRLWSDFDNYDILINVEAGNAVARRFAEAFGFELTDRDGNTLIMERPCKQYFL